MTQLALAHRERREGKVNHHQVPGNSRPESARCRQRKRGRVQLRAAVAVSTAAVSIVTATVSAGVASAAPVLRAEPAPPGLERFYHQQLRWTGCGDKDLDRVRAQCALVTVPLDYARPGARTITVAISRIKATNMAARRGVLLTNSGGPGGAGLNYTVPGLAALNPGVAARYDLIGMDPRGVGRSAPVRCNWPLPIMLRAAGPDFASFAQDVALEGVLAAQCLAADPEMMLFTTTRNTARDMEVIRSVLGEPKISYLGVSYGSYLGAVYTQMFGHRADRMVFDSALDPDRYWLGTVQDMGAANEAALDDWADWVAARNSRYQLGTSRAQIRSVLDDLIRRSASQPIMLERLPLDAHMLPMVVLQLLSDPRLNEVLADIVRLMVSGLHGRAGALDNTTKQLLAKATSADGSAMAAIACGDVAMPRDPGWYWGNIERSRAAQPVFGAFANNIQACAFWPPPVEPPTVVRNNAAALIVQATRDPRTAYQGGVALHRAMPASRLVTLHDVRVHVAFRPGISACVRQAVNRYLGDGVLPAPNLVCRADASWPGPLSSLFDG